ncbi:MAG: carbohydrate binding domain-containing protein [Chloroflexi bacterium]|nr:carbohydrate binding domain-containing protein [Chloroflexota bacterium]
MNIQPFLSRLTARALLMGAIFQSKTVARLILIFMFAAFIVLFLSPELTSAQDPNPESDEATGVNLLQNPSFESGNLSFWSGWGSPGVVGVQNCCAKSGSYSAYLEPRGAYKELYQNVAVNPGYRYRLKAFVYTNGVTANLGFYSNASGDVTCDSANSSTYTKLVCAFVVPYGTTNFDVHIWANGPL